jgi:N-acetylglucosamine-6-phosphate deacetylase
MTFSINGIHYRTGEPISVSVTTGIISSIQPLSSNYTGSLPIIAPGLVDLQINGYGGCDFNSQLLSEKHFQTAARMICKQGVTSFFPTIITNSDEMIFTALRRVAAACLQDELVNQMVKGIHLEGPFISPEDGPRGAHHKAFVKAPDWELFKRWQEEAAGKIKIVTLSPEWPEAVKFINNCVESGVTVSIGHTSATPEQIREAVEAGATMSTHLGNGAHLMLPRHPHYIWEQLAQDALWASIIADGHHLPDSVMKVILRVKGQKSVLVSDAVFLSGMPPGVYETHIGGKVVLTPEGKLHIANHPGLLAGSVKMLLSGIEHLAKTGLAEFTEAWEMASIRPANLLGLPVKDGLQVGAPADFVMLTWDGNKADILITYKNGVMVGEE